MIEIEIEPDDRDPADPLSGYVLRVFDGDNRNLLLSSTTQGYRNAKFVEDLARRLFPPIRDATNGPPEPVTLKVTGRNGRTKTEILR